VAPPCRRAAQPYKARRLGGDAVGRHKLLLLADRVEKAQRVAAEAEQRQQRQRSQAQQRAHRRPDALARVRSAKHEEGQHEAAGDLDADAGDQRRRARAQMRVGARGEREGDGEHQQDQRVVVRAAHREHEQDRVESHERGRRRRGMTETPGRACHKRHRPEARRGGDRFEHPQAARDAERRGRVAEERVERTVGGVLERPADEPEDRIGARFGGDVRVGVEPVQRAHASEREVAEDVLGDQGRPERQDHVREHDRARERAPGHRSGGDQHEQIARAHDQHQRLKAVSGEARSEALERSRHPVRPAADAGRDVFRRFRGGVGAEQQRGGQHPHQAERTEPAQDSRGRLRVSRPAGRRGRRTGDLDAGCGGRGLNDGHCCV
jgi:hypothetical protein